MKFLIFISFFFFGLSCTSSKKMASGPERLNGTWLPVSQEMGGTSLPKAAFEHQKLIISDTNYTVIAESVDKGIVKIAGDKMDIYGKEGVNAGKHFTALFKFENGALTVCYNLTGTAYPEAFETKSKRLLFLSVFHKEGSK